MKKLIFLTLIVSLALLFISCEGDTNAQTEVTTGSEETVAETVTTAETTTPKTTAELATTSEATSNEETVVETVTTAEVTSDEETIVETVTTTETTVDETATTSVTIETEFEDKTTEYTSEIITDNVPVDTYKPAVELIAYSWDEFIKEINNYSNINQDFSNDVNRYNILTGAIELSGCNVTTLLYSEYELEKMSTQSDWNFDLYWNEIESDYEIRCHIFYIPDGVDVSGATYGYRIYDKAHQIYTKNINNGKTSYVCLINDNIFMRMVVKNECNNFEIIVNQLLEYSLKIKNLVNGTEETPPIEKPDSNESPKTDEYTTDAIEETTETTVYEETTVETVTTAEATSDEETTEANQCTVPFNTVLFQTPQESSSKFNISKASADFSEKIYVDETATSYITLDIFGNEYKLSYKESAQLPRSDMIVNTYQYLGDEDDFKILINAATGEIVEYIGVSYEHNCISEEDYLDCIKSLLPEKYSLDLYNSYKVYTHYYSFGENYMESKEIEGFKMCGENEQLGGHTFVFTQKIGNVSLANHVSVEFSHGSIYIELYDFGYDLDEASVFIESFEKVESQFKTYITSKAKEDYTVSNIENKFYQFFMKGGIPYIMITSEIEMYRGEDKSQTFSALLKTFTTFDIES